MPLAEVDAPALLEAVRGALLEDRSEGVEKLRALAAENEAAARTLLEEAT